MSPRKFKKAHPGQTVESWSQQKLGSAFTQRLLAPALNGIYAGNISKLSASLVINRFFDYKKKSKKKNKAQLLSGESGMSSIMLALENYLVEHKVQFHFNSQFSSKESSSALVLAVPAPEASNILLRLRFKEAELNAALLKKIEYLSLVTTTCFFEKPPASYLGFGILFPALSKVKALGVLMNSEIFKRTFQSHSETWIMGGALQPDILELSDLEIKKLILENRKSLFGVNEPIQELKITRWPQALPHYTIELEKIISELVPMQDVFLHGNYLGSLGLSRLLEKSKELAQHIQNQFQNNK